MSAIPVRFDEASRAALYRVMELRRDIRHFRPGAIDDDVLARILSAAELAPSVGYSQPWGFVVLRDRTVRARIRESFLRCREAEAARFPEDRREAYLAFKLEGIEESTLNVCVVADLRPRDEAILGTTVQPESVRASVCCAVQNLWLAARAEGLGVGWVSIVEPAVLREELALPAGVEPIAYLCVGHAEEFRERPMLEENGWRPRRPSVVHRNRWSDPPTPGPGPSSAPARSLRPAPAPIPLFDEAVARQAREHQRLLTKPPGSLGRLEEIAVWYAGAHGRFPPPRPEHPLVAVFAADHGVAASGVSAYPSSVTAAMLANVMAGGAAISCMARRLGVDVALVDVGVAGDLSMLPTKPLIPLTRASIRAGTANLAHEPAMTLAEAERAMHAGEEIALRAAAENRELLAIGEIGIGNTTSAAALLCAFTGASPADVVGFGTGISPEAHARKIRVVEDALRRLALAPHGSAPHGSAPHTVDPDGASPHTVAPHGGSPHTVDPDGASPHTVDPDGASPHTVDPDGASPHTVAPHGGAPHTVDPHGGAPHTVDPHGSASYPARDPLTTLAAVGGLELAAMSGFMLAAARRRIPVVLDGFLATVAAIVAAAFDPRVTDYLLASHASAERGATIASAALGKTPILNLDMRLGEGTGAVLALDLVRTAVDAQFSMATFATAGIVGRSGVSVT
ncbi:5,6-dimethylbenzimidazole synthase [Pendulispora albinea]|uniref:Nicotinate-nucleotide--dimethylbenzimidazole phosphoribosyltransferase n=1 Tax=Pendulispora albinea TaxID=2741071 RepID=A0ABZ2M0A8_9BACT